jgi:transcriptional repressor NrdR
MKCPFCGAIDDKVLESRQNSSGTTIRRRRECLACSYRFTSYEKIEETPLMVIKSDDRREPFDLKKIERGLLRAIEKRPVSRLKLDEVLHKIEDQAEMKGKGTNEISSEEIGEMVLSELFKLDEVAYVRFASVYRQFEEVGEFVSVIEKLSEKNS